MWRRGTGARGLVGMAVVGIDGLDDPVDLGLEDLRDFFKP